MSFDARVLTGIRVLTAVVEAGSFVGAAEMLGLTPSGVSRAIARLEARLGVRLVDRNPRSVALTEEGRRFHAQVLPLLDRPRRSFADAASAPRPSGHGRLRVMSIRGLPNGAARACCSGFWPSIRCYRSRSGDQQLP